MTQTPDQKYLHWIRITAVTIVCGLLSLSMQYAGMDMVAQAIQLAMVALLPFTVRKDLRTVFPSFPRLSFFLYWLLMIAGFNFKAFLGSLFAGVLLTYCIFGPCID